MRILFFLALAVLMTGASSGWAQDTRPRVEPTAPPTCTTLNAPLRIGAHGPAAGNTAAQENGESGAEAAMLQRALDNCSAAHAVELTLGASGRSAFLINPVTLPAGVSLIVDGGVTVYATRNPKRFQDPANPKIVCGTVGENFPINGGCLSLFTLTSDSGIYGDGVLDGQGQRGMISNGSFGAEAWWDLLFKKKQGDCGAQLGTSASGCEQASPPMISAGFFPSGLTGNNLTLLNITVRNPPFHTIRLAGHGITVWGVKVQAPWNVPNSDGFDVQGDDVLFQNDIVANGDQDIAIVSNNDIPTRNMSIAGLTAYGKGGVALLDAGKAIENLVVSDMAMTGDIASFVPQAGGTNALVNGVNVLTATLRGTTQHLTSYGQALPTATHDSQGLQINWNTNRKRAFQTPGPVYSAVTFGSVCLQDIVNPIHVGPVQGYYPRQKPDNMPTVDGIVFRNIHVLAPTQQFPKMDKGVVSPGASGTYAATFAGDPKPTVKFFVPFTLNNVVFDDLPSGTTSLSDLQAVGNVIGTVTNVYPAALNDLTANPPPYKGWMLGDNRYARQTQVSNSGLAVPCPLSRWPFLTGDLYLTLPPVPAASSQAAQGPVVIPTGGTITLNAVLQPAMSQTTWFMKQSYGATPGLLAVGSPALIKRVVFYENGSVVGSGQLTANGMLATASIKHIASGTHTYTAQYPGDKFYRPFAFGSVSVRAK